MNFFRDVVSHLLKNAFEGHTKFSVADAKAVGDNPIRSITLDAVPVNENVMISLAWEGGDKLFEKTMSEQEASHQFDLISNDLAEVAALTKQGEYDSAKALMTKLGQKYAENTGDIVDTNLPKLHNTQASQNENRERVCVKCLKLFNSKEDALAHVKDNDGHHIAYNERNKDAAQEDHLWREAKITMQNLWFSTTDELLDYQKKQKGATGDQDNIPLWDKNKKQKGPLGDDELAPASLSYEDVENQKEKEHDDMQKHIDEKIKTELESALQQKAASVFGPDQVELVQVLRKNGRNWDEIKKILVKDFGFEKDATAIFVDEQRQGSDPTGIEVEPVKEEEKPLTPPEDLVSPETHEKLLQDHEDKKKVDSPVKEDKAPEFSPKDVMDIPEDDEITDESSLLTDEIARADNDDIHKVAAGQDLNPLQEPLTEKPTTPNQDVVPMGKKPLDHNAPQKGDRVFVSSDLTSEHAGFEGTFISNYQSKGVDFSIVETDQGDLLDVESHRVTKTSEGTGAQDTEPVMEPVIEQQQPDQAIPTTPKMDDFHTSSQDNLSKIKADAAVLLHLYKVAELDKQATETFTSPVDVDDLYMKQLLGHEEITSMKPTSIQWQLEFEMREWGIKGVAVYVPDQTIELSYEYFQPESAEGAADDTYVPESKKVQITNVQVEGLDRNSWDVLTPQTLTLESDGKWVVDFGTASHYTSSLKTAEGNSTMDTKCEDCGKVLGPEAFLSKWPVCGACTRKKHKKVTQGSDFEKGISQNKTSDETLPAAPGKKKNPSLKDKDLDPYKFHSDLEWEKGDPCKLCKSPIDENCVCTNPECEFCKDRIGQAYGATKPEGSEPDQVDLIMAYEQGDLDEAGILKLFSQLIKSGDAWKLQGSYGRTAKALIEAGYINEQGTITKDVVDTEIVPEQKMISKLYSFKSQKTAAEPVEAPKTQFKDYKITPKYTPKEDAMPATPEMGEVLSKMEALQTNLATLETARKQIQAKMKEEMEKIDQQGGRAEMEAALQETIEKTAVILSAMDNKVVQWKDKLYTLQTEQVDLVPSLTPKEMLAKIYAKFDGAEKYVQDVLNGMLSQAKRIVEKTLIRWPNKKSSITAESSILDEMNHFNEELMAALKELSSPL